MKYKLSLALRNHRGEPLIEDVTRKDPSGAVVKTGEVTMTLGLVLERACLFGGEQDAKHDAKYKQFKLAQRIAAGLAITAEPVEFDAAEVDTLKKLCAQVYTPIAYGAVVDALENPQVDELPADVAEVIGAGGTE